MLADHIRPDLIVGASVGSLNGYVIASGATPEELRSMWLDPAFARFADLPSNIRRMMAHYTPRIPFAITATELPRMKPRIFRDSEITWQHLAASCALPLALPQVRIGTHWYSDGGLLGALPLWAAAELGAKRSWVCRRCRSRRPGGCTSSCARSGEWRDTIPPVPPGIEVLEIRPGRPLGSVRDTIQWKRSNIERWLDQGAEDARLFRTAAAVTEKTFFF